MKFLIGIVKNDEFWNYLRSQNGGRNRKRSHEIKAFRPYFQANKKCI